jgi:CRP/FNR family transcriptional regulator
MYAINSKQQIDRFHTDAVAARPSPPTIEALFDRQVPGEIEAGVTLFLEGDRATHLYEVVEGVLRVFKRITDGRRVITGFLYPGDLVGASLKDRHLFGAEAVTRTRFRRFGRREFQEAINNSPELRPQLFARLCDEMAAAQNQIVLLSCKTAEERLCSFLFDCLKRERQTMPSTSVIQLPMTRLDIADYLGLTIETVSRTITKLTGRGIIATEGRHALRILKTSTLARLAGDGCDDEDYLPALIQRN